MSDYILALTEGVVGNKQLVEGPVEVRRLIKVFSSP